MGRPFINLTFEAIKAKVEASWGDIPALALIAAELGHRKKNKKAPALRIRVNRRIAELSGKSLTAASVGPKSTSLPFPPDDSTQSGSLPPLPISPPPTVTPPPPTVTPPSRPTAPPPRPTWLDGDDSPSASCTAENILAAWTSFEVLAPRTYVKPADLADGDRYRVSWFDGKPLPWEQSQKSKKGFRLYHQVVVGGLRMEPAIGKLLSVYRDNRQETPPPRGTAALAVILVDKSGIPVESPAVTVSSFGWGFTTAVAGSLRKLAAWPTIERRLTDELDKTLRRHLQREPQVDDSPPILDPLNRTAINAIYSQLVNWLRLPEEMLEPPSFSIKSYVPYKSGDAEPLLLNSFFLEDLATARKLVAAGDAPSNLHRYLGTAKRSAPRDLLKDNAALEEAVAPAATPLARWPAPGRHSLVLLQQAAVNLAFRETRSGGLLGVNGPPGTGKTTLLRDLVAGVVTERAEAMLNWDDPEHAFKATGKKLKAGDGWLHLYQLDERLRGFEIVVASSNNKAVENVSRELPARRAIAEDAADLTYFQSLSDRLNRGADGDEPSEGSDTWGLIAAVLGNARNRSQFKQTFWWDEDYGLNAYLRAATGGNPTVQEGVGENAVDRRPKIVEVEKPPASKAEALIRWRDARVEFRRSLQDVRDWQQRLEEVRHAVQERAAAEQEEAELRPRVATAVANISQLSATLEDSDRKRDTATEDFWSCNEALAGHRQSKPNLFATLFSTERAKKWRDEESGLARGVEAASKRLQLIRDRNERVSNELAEAVEEHKRLLNRADTAARTRADAVQKIYAAKNRYSLVLVDESFFASEHPERQLSTPWLTAEVQLCRDELFSAALRVHRAFIDAAARPLKHNLGALMGTFSGSVHPNAAEVIEHLWASLFLVVPLVSTTFASVSRMFGRLGPGALGWLLVDEAGQALPQAAVGAMLRSRRAVFVGDPVQVEPVVTLPDTLSTAICRNFNIDPERYAAPAASAQTLADAASAFESEFQTASGFRNVGVPLLVHRRCSEPMFAIANRVAYAGLMVNARKPKPSRIRDVLGPPHWIDVVGSGEDKWCEAEGEVVVRLLSALAEANVVPDLYIVTPFRIVAQRLRELVRSSGKLQFSDSETQAHSPNISSAYREPKSWCFQTSGEML